MLRITEMFEDVKTITLKLDGKLVGTCISHLEEQCLNYKAKKNKTVLLDFSGVSYIETDGVRMLESIQDEKFQIVNCPLFIEALLQDLISEEKGDKR